MNTVEQQATTNHAYAAEYVTPSVNITENKDSYILEAEMPGVTKDGLEITLEGTELTIVGRRTPDKVSGQPLLRERSRADYRRVFELDPVIDTTKVVARMQQGMLVLNLPKTEKVKPRRITVAE